MFRASPTLIMLARILGNHGVDVTIAGKKSGQRTSDGQTFKLTAPDIVDTTAPYEMVARMRAGFWVLAPLVARCGRAKVSLPAAAPSARAPSICISPRSRRSEPKSNSKAAT